MVGRRAVAALLIGLVCAGCATGEADTALLPPATAAVSPPAAGPEGTTRPAPAGSTLIVTGGTLVVAVDQPPRLLRLPLGQPGAAGAETPLPGVADRLTHVDGVTTAVVPSAGVLVRLAADGTVSTTPAPGGPVDVARVGGAEVVALRDTGTLTISPGGTVTGLTGVDGVIAVNDKAVVLDRARSSLTEVHVADRRVGVALRAGEGAVAMIPDRFGRVLAVDTRGGEFMAFSTDPLLMRQRFPLPGGPYALAYDRTRDLAWVTLTERNEVVGLDVAGGEPVERHRFRTVGQPNAVAVDETDGRVYVLSARGEGIQVIQP